MAKKGKKKFKNPAKKQDPTPNRKTEPIQKETLQKSKVAAVVPPTRSSTIAKPFIFGRTNYMYMLAGFGFLLLGLLLMSGGGMPSPDVWDDSIIYSHRRITLAPILMIIGLVLEVMAIFKR